MINEDNRSFRRMAVEAMAEVTMPGLEGVELCRVGDLSAVGLLLWTDKTLAEGALLDVKINPGHPITPPLEAEVEVIRTQSEEDGSNQVACRIIQIR